MELTIIEGLRTLKLDLVLTLALAALFLFVGGWLQRRVGVFARASIPSAAIGGLLFAALVMILRRYAPLGVTIDSTLRAPLQTAFFTTIGYGATLGLLRAGGARMIFFFIIASLMAVVQNFAGIAVALALKAPPALGIICGSLTLTGGPATGLAFTSLFEQKGVAGAGALIIASATFGIFVSSLVGNPVATALIRRRRLAPKPSKQKDDGSEQFWAIGSMAPPDEETPVTDAAVRAKDEARTTEPGELLRNLLLILLAMGVGALISFAATRGGITLPGYVGTMLVAGVARNLDDRYGWLRIDTRAMDALGTVALALFLVIALMDLKLWQLAGLAVPMLVILAAQVVLMILYAVFVTFVLMGRDYEAAVTSSGHIGFGLGITPNAVANMEALAARFGPAPRSFLVVPVVGAFFIDFTNAVVITAFANWIK
ncbi:MAG: sodium/glutamate symporter [Acidobacteria bacterium]|nr:sodium/glutamate symporter [Acidobacteriota bacterium]MCA1640619.1 sodium/glutamate symporter [Acidobacteriota bacterium]